MPPLSYLLTDPPSRRARVLLSAYAISPYEGGECAVGWNRMLQTAQRHDVWVLYGKRKSADDLAKYFRDRPELPGVTFIHQPMNRREQWLADLGGVIPYNLAYRAWQRRMLAVAQGWHQRVQFDLVHQAVFCGFREPGYLWQLGVPFVWGPVGGTDSCPRAFRRSLGWFAACAETLRAAITALQLRLSRRLKKVADQAAVILAANTQVQRQLIAAYGRDARILLETGLPRVAESRPVPPPHQELRLLWSGHFMPTKALHLLLAALAQIPRDARIHLRVLGDGACRKRWQQLAERLGVADRVTWLGWQEHAIALEQLAWADVLVFTSLRDTSGNVALEALGAGIPVVCLDHQGMHDIVTSDCGIKIPAHSPRQVVRELAAALRRLAEDRRRLAEMSARALERARAYLWDRNGAVMEQVFQSVLGELPISARPATVTEAALTALNVS